jgi:hypothetical protein
VKLTRVYPDAEGKIKFPPCSYGQDRGVWYIRLPGCHLGSVNKHTVVEHYEDGTITVSPSILHHDYEMVDGVKRDKTVHGYIEHGVWREC